MYQAQVEVTTFTETLTPYLPLIGTIIGALVVGLFAIVNRSRGAVENRAPDVNEIWQRQAADQVQLDAERRLRRGLEDFVRELRRAFWSYVRRVQGGGGTDLTTSEQRVLESDPPSIDQFKTL